MDIIMLRHGESEDNAKKIFSRDECKLTEVGRAQIVSTIDYLEKEKIDTIICSPLERTRETLKVLRKELTANIVFNHNIAELDFGDFKGKSYNQCLEIFNSNAQAWADDPFSTAPPNGESISKAFRRATIFIEELINKGENVLLITHDGFIRLAFCYVLGDYNQFFKFKVDNGSISRIKIFEDFSQITMINYKG